MKRSQENACAYCGRVVPLTREHVIPDFLYKRYPTQRFGYHQKARRYLEYEAKVRDVCHGCNSGALSKLDSYGKWFTEKNQCHRTFRSRPTIQLIYDDFDRLLRWLLKVAYNAMRANDRNTMIISEAAGFILHGKSLPFHAELLVEVIRNAPIADDHRHLLPKSMRHADSLTAHRFRVGEFGAATGESPQLCRFVALNAFYFYIVLFPDAIPADRVRAYLAELHSYIPQAARLRRQRKNVQVRVSKRTIHEAYLDQALRELPAWLDYSAEGSKNRP